MSAETNFRELFQGMIEQFQLSPQVAKMLLQRILEILSQEKQDIPDIVFYKRESEDKYK